MRSNTKAAQDADASRLEKFNRHSGLTKLHESYSWSFGIISAAKIILDDIPADEKGNEAQDDEVNCLQIREIFQHSASPSQGRRFGIFEAANEGRANSYT